MSDDFYDKQIVFALFSPLNKNIIIHLIIATIQRKQVRITRNDFIGHARAL
jgi:hypothetical protein